MKCNYYNYTSTSSTLKVPRILDIGCGTGVLGFIARLKNAQLYALDSNPAAVKVSKINAQHLKIPHFVAAEADLTDEGQLKSVMREYKYPQSYDIIIANPPWVCASPLSNVNLLENAVYDEKGRFLNSILEFT
jgi:methylase of polypeptide subunit release factors